MTELRPVAEEATTAPAVDDVARIVAIADRVIRNLEITQCYAELSDAVRARLGPTANWCTFATWASRQAGSTIRGEDLLGRWQRRLGSKARLLAPVQSAKRWLLSKGVFEPDTRLGRIVAEIHTPFDAFERASEAVAEGNLRVFEEIGHEFARFIATVPASALPQSETFGAFLAGLRPGPPPDGQRYLREAFAHYQEPASDPAMRAAWMLLANLKIGLHEQTRLQPQIAAGLDAPLITAADLGTRVLHVMLPASRHWPRLLHATSASIVGWVARGVRSAAVKITREIVTESMMVLTLPNRVLLLGDHLDAPVPPALADASLGPLVEFVTAHDPCTSDRVDCGARDWCELAQRMHYILHLFRAYAQEPSLFTPPFSVEQVASFRAGRVPSGVLT